VSTTIRIPFCGYGLIEILGRQALGFGQLSGTGQDAIEFGRCRLLYALQYQRVVGAEDEENLAVGQAQALAEYALILALIAVVCIVVLKFLGSMTASKISDVGNAMK